MALLKEFNLHTIVRLPLGVFEPYTDIQTNILFFDRTGPTKEIWFYEQPLPEGRKKYTKTKPMKFDEFGDCLAWWHNREENDQAWKVSIDEILQYNGDSLVSANLDLKNPNGLETLVHKPPEELVADIFVKEQRILEILGQIKTVLHREEA